MNNKSKLFEEVKNRMVTKIKKLNRKEGVKTRPCTKERKSYSRAKHDEGLGMMSAEEFFADPE